MQNELSQEQIDAMLRAAQRGDNSEVRAKEPRVELWDARRAGEIGREQLQAITQLHEGFARSLTHSLESYLRVVFSATLVSAEHLTYCEFLERLPETTYLAAYKLEPMAVNGALQMDLKVLFPIIDLLLGGEGNAASTPREITEIEEQLVESVARIVCRDLSSAWKAVDLEVGFDKRIEPSEAHRLLLPDDKMLSLSFEITVLEVRGGLNLAVPIAVSHALLRKIMEAERSHRVRGRSVWREALKHRLLECPFLVELAVNELNAPVGEISHLAPGQLLSLRKDVTQPASVMVAGVEMFPAAPARFGETRAIQVLANRDEPEVRHSEIAAREETKP